jgi:uncharacterized cupredoxin-like copper-binding protein
MLSRMRVATLITIASAAAAGVALPASADPATSAKGTTVKVTAGAPSQFRFTLSTSTVKAGSVTFNVTNKAKIPHDFKIGGKTTPLINPGKSASLTVSLKKGSAPYMCTVPGHAALGMKGTLKVT